jgi:hypothetical protein
MYSTIKVRERHPRPHHNGATINARIAFIYLLEGEPRPDSDQDSRFPADGPRQVVPPSLLSGPGPPAELLPSSCRAHVPDVHADQGGGVPRGLRSRRGRDSDDGGGLDRWAADGSWSVLPTGCWARSEATHALNGGGDGSRLASLGDGSRLASTEVGWRLLATDVGWLLFAWKRRREPVRRVRAPARADPESVHFKTGGVHAP